MINTAILLQAGQQDFSSIVMIVGMVIVFYFFMIRPQQRKQKQQKEFESTIKKGDSVITTGGLHGKIAASDANTVTLEIDKGVRLVFERSSISMEMTSNAKAGSKEKE